MRRNGMTQQRWRAFTSGLARTHYRDIELTVLDLSGRNPRGVAAPVISGQLTVDMASDPAQVLEVTLLDPHRRLALDPGAGSAPVHRTRMLRVTDVRIVDTPLGRVRVDTEIFTGPIHDVDRTGELVTVVAHDKSALAMGEVWAQRTFGEGAKRTAVLQQILAMSGETRMSVAKGTGKLGKKLVLLRMDKAWPKARGVARAMNRQLWYSGLGVAICRRASSKVQWTVPAAMVLSPVRVGREPGTRPNTFVLSGNKPEGKDKDRVVSDPWYLKASHPDSAQSLARGPEGKRIIRRHVQRRENDKVKSKKTANAIARGMRNDAAGSLLTTEVDIVPVPFIEPYDVVKVATATGTHKVRCTRYTYPLVDGPMVLGATRRVGKPRPSMKRTPR